MIYYDDSLEKQYRIWDLISGSVIENLGNKKGGWVRMRITHSQSGKSVQGMGRDGREKLRRRLFFELYKRVYLIE